MNLDYGNASSLHSYGQIAKNELIKARTKIATLIGVAPLSLILTSSGSESNNTVVRTFENCPIFVSAIEHPSVLKPAETYGSPCVKIPVSQEGIIDLVFLKAKLEETIRKTPKTKILVSVMLANNEVGTIEPIKKIAALIKELRTKHRTKIYFHTDATQAVGKISVDVKTLGVDYLTFTGHKLGAPVGVAALYSRLGAPLKPLILGGAQESHRRAGTSNVLLACAFAKACELAKKNLEKYQKVEILRDYLKEGIKQKIKSQIVITPKNSLPNLLCVSFPASEGESTQLYLDLAGFEVSTGSACASGDLEPSHVLMAMFHDAEIAHGSVRFSLGPKTTKKEIDLLLENLPPIIEKIQDLSTLNKENPNVRK